MDWDFFGLVLLTCFLYLFALYVAFLCGKAMATKEPAPSLPNRLWIYIQAPVPAAICVICLRAFCDPYYSKKGALEIAAAFWLIMCGVFYVGAQDGFKKKPESGH
jgi:hypothetical protein